MDELQLLLSPWRGSLSSWLFFVAGYIGLRCLWQARTRAGHAQRETVAIGLGCLAMGGGLFIPALGSIPVFSLMALSLIAGAYRPVRAWPRQLLLAIGSAGLIASTLVMLLGFSVGFGQGPSMWPTAPRSLSWLVVERGKLPERGERVEFGVPTTQGSLDEMLGWPSGRYHKRVIGLPGDVVAIDRQGLTVNGRRMIDCKTALASSEASPLLHGTWLCVGEARQAQQWAAVWGEADLWDLEPRKWTVPQGHYWVLGDNAVESADSRLRGAIPAEWISGVVLDL